MDAAGPGLEIVRVTEADASLVELINLAYRCPPGTGSAWTFEGDLIEGDRISAAGLQREWARGGTTLVARENGKAVGTVTVWRDDTEVATVGLLAVLPTLQGRGLGARLLAAAERTAAELGAKRCSLWLLPCRPELAAYYARRGFALQPNRSEPFPAGQGFGDPRPEAYERCGGEVRFVCMEKNLL
jgi:GNAT superfamily N-acetyltransferase